MDKALIGRKVVIRDSGSPKAWEIVGFHSDGRVRISFDDVVSPNTYPLDRLELLQLPADPHSKAQRFGIFCDAPRITHDEATEMLAHFLMLSHMYFQITPEDAREEVVRIISLREGPAENGSVMVGAMAAFDAWHAHYERLKVDLG